MKKKTKIFLLCCCAAAIVLLLFLLPGRKAQKQQPSVSPSPVQAAQSMPPESAALPSSAAAASPAAESVPARPAELSTAERQRFESLLNEDACYGFLLSQYSDVRSADLDQIFYIGAGIPSEADAASITAAYQAACGDDAPQTDCTVLKTEQINAFLKKTTGYTLAQMRSKLDWDYDPSHDAYLFFYGDTNKISIRVASGKALDGGQYKLTCTFDGAFYDLNAGEVSGCVVSFIYQNGSPVFLSNTFIK